MKILFATHNTHKISEVKGLLGDDFEIISPAAIGFLDDVEETGSNLIENALLKVNAYPETVADIIFAEDTGLEVEALNGAPGVYTARYAGLPPDSNKNMAKLLFEIKDKPNRNAQFRTVICLKYHGKTHYFEGICKGTIALEKEGNQGFGYDPIFIPDGYNLSFGSLGNDIKKKLSHRAMAIQQMLKFFKSLA